MSRALPVLTAAALVGCCNVTWAVPRVDATKSELEVLWERYWQKDDLTVGECAKLIRHYSPLVRTWAAYSLGRRGEAAMPVVMEALRDPDPRVRRAGLDAIAGPVALGTGGRRDKHKMTPEIVAQAVPLIAENLKHEDLWVRDGALLAFMVTGKYGEKYLPQIMEYLATDEDWWLRDAAARAIGGLGKDHAQEAIVPLAEAYVRETHVVAQRKMKEALFQLDLEAGAHLVLPIFVEALRNPTKHKMYDAWYFRSMTLDVLEKMGPSAKGAAPAIRELIDEYEQDRTQPDVEARIERLQQALDAVTGGEQ
ncbi:MAG: HEAT repeat domain-containing protein [Armatimonadota bacterium]